MVAARVKIPVLLLKKRAVPFVQVTVRENSCCERVEFILQLTFSKSKLGFGIFV